MAKTIRYKKKNNKTKRNKKKNNYSNTEVDIELFKNSIGLKSFEKKFSENKTNHYKNKKEFVKELLSNFSPNSIKPENDYYDYINYQWLKEVSLEKQQEYIVQVDDFRLAQDRVFIELNQIILEYIKNNNNNLSKNLKNYYNSVIDMNPKSYSKQLAKQDIKQIEELIQKNNPWELLAYFNKDEMLSLASPFVWSLNPDEKNTKIYCNYINPHQFNLLDLSIYYDDGKNREYKKKYKNTYKKCIKDVFHVLLGKNNLNPQDVLDVETDIFNAMGCIDITKDEEKMYNKISANESLSKYGFNWNEFSIYLGYKTPPSYFVTTSLNYLKCGSDLFVANWNTPKWKTYWIYILLRRLVRITKDWEDIIFKFKGEFEKGQKSINKNNAVSSTLYMSLPFNTFLTNEYVKKYENPNAIHFTKVLCNDLKIVFRKILNRNTWLEPSTKKYALKKLDHFNFVYGKPENLRKDPDLKYGNLLYDNLMKINEWRHKKFIELDGKEIIDIPMLDWSQYPVKMTGTQAYIVNASYTPAKNSIYINLGYIQKPFVDLDDRGIEYNLAHLGFTIGHEMSHGFDDMGSQYGWDGNLYDWWTPSDKKKYKAIQDDVVKQYEEFALKDGIKFDASIGVGEDLADISGLAICDEYLKDFQDNNKDLVPIKRVSFEGFFIYYAAQQKQLVSQKALSAQLKTNPHPLDKYRCNVPLSRSEIFRALFNVKKGDGMWWHNTNTVW